MKQSRILRGFWDSLNTIEDKISLLDTYQSDVSVIRNLTYTNYPKDNQSLDLIYPPAEKESYPLIMLVHGGGFVSGNHTRYYIDYAYRLANRGFLVANINYRLSGDFAFPASLEDLFSALRFLINQASTYHCDLANVFLVGESAGATLSSLMAAIFTNQELKKVYPFAFDFKLQGCGLSCGVYDVETTLKELYWVPLKKATMAEVFMRQDFRNAPLYPQASALHYVTSDFPPTYLMTSALDFLMPQTQHMRHKFIEKKVLYVYDFYPLKQMLPHSFHTKFFYPQSKIAMDRMLIFFESLMMSAKKGNFRL
jgi:acetyl esterase/lipase